jgi:putative oxidoreductase
MLLGVENRVHALLVRSSIGALRISLGAVFLAFGVLKYFPGVSPAQGLAVATTDILFFGRLPGSVAIVLIATLECAIGLLLIVGRGLRLAVYLLFGQLIGILSPVVLLSGRLFAGPHGAPTLEGQYVLKDVVLVAAAMVVTAGSFRGGRLVRAEVWPTPASPLRDAPIGTRTPRIH